MNDADDRAAVDRAFADLVAGFHVTAERPDPDQPSDWDEPAQDPPAPGSVFETPTPDRHQIGEPPFEPTEFELPEIEVPDEDEESEPTPEERYEPGPVAPLPRPAWPMLAGWVGIGYAVLTVLAVALGFALPHWAAVAGVIGFAAGLGLLLSRLPRHRPPDAGDGAVV